jgi:V8-like Glu-specific endopeptidase/ribosomal protein L27
VPLILAASVLPPALAQPAPVRRAVVPADAAPEAMSGLFADLRGGEQTISIPGAAWLQLQLSDVRLGPDGTLTITSAAGDSQSFSQAEIEAWGGLTAILNGSELRVTLTPGPGATEPVTARIADIIIGLPPAEQGAAEAAPQPLINLLGGDLDRFIPAEVRRPRTEGAAPEAICGATDDRVASSNPRSGRIMPVGCTGWLIDGGALLTAGHCTGASMQTVEFNVPASQANGTTVSPPARDQYRVTAGSVVTQNTGVGNDWAFFTVLPNTETGLLPAAAQGATFQLSNTQNPANVRITGFGVDGPAPNFGAGGPRDATNQTQQTHVGALSTNTGGANSGTLRYNTDTQGGNSGSPVIVEGTNVAIGIHTNGGCTSTGGTNAGTSFRNEALWTAIGNAAVRTGDVLWRHINGQVHYWPMLNGQRQGGLNIFTPVGPEWRLAGSGDVSGDGTEDILWQHINGQVHFWPMQSGQRQGGLNIFTPVGPEWRLAGSGDVNGDGTDDVVWQHINGQVHFWPMQNGQRQGGLNIFSPVGPEWRLAGVGDLNGDRTDDILWQHINGQAHYWPMQNGQRQGGLNIFTPIGPEWRLSGVGDLNGDGTDDILWQHINGQVHFWPMQNGQRQGGLNIFSPVGPEWRLAGVASVD